MSEQLKSWLRMAMSESPEAKGFRAPALRDKAVSDCVEVSLQNRDGEGFKKSTLWKAFELAARENARLKAEIGMLKMGFLPVADGK